MLSITGFTLLEFLMTSVIYSVLITGVILSFSTFLTFYDQARRRLEQLENAVFACYCLRQQLIHVRAVKPPHNDIFEVYRIEKPNVKQVFFIAQAFPVISNKPEPALFMREGSKPRIELARGVSAMTLEYGIRCQTSNDICEYGPAERVSNWLLVKSLQITLHFKNKWLSQWRLYIACGE